jgi:small-conductance mechanosensitive channel
MFKNLFTAIILEKIIESVVLLVIAWLVNLTLQKLIHIPRRLETRRAKTLTTVFKSAVSIAVYTTALYFIFKVLGIDVTPILASAGIAGLAIGFGARSLVADLISGAFLLVEDSIAVGDLVRAAGVEGVVKRISFRTVTLRDKNGIVHIVPNGEVKTVANLSRAKARVNIDLTVPIETKIDNLLKVANKTLEEFKKDKEYGKKVFEGSAVKGIEDFLPNGKMVVKIVLFTNWRYQWELARAFRLFLKRNLEKAKIIL